MKNEISMFFHCKQCLAEIPPNTSHEEYARLSVGITPEGDIQVWCVRHDTNIVHTGKQKLPEHPKCAHCEAEEKGGGHA
jgi:hypothetical protein